jgi:hypothetical protein
MIDEGLNFVDFQKSLSNLFESKDKVDNYWRQKELLSRAMSKLEDKVFIPAAPRFSMKPVMLALDAQKWATTQIEGGFTPMNTDFSQSAIEWQDMMFQLEQLEQHTEE